MKKAILLVIVVAFNFMQPSSHALPKVGTSCKVSGTVQSNLVCMTEGKKRVWRKLDSVKAVQTVIELSLKSNKLPTKLTPKIERARLDKSPWLEPDCSVDFSSNEITECIAGAPNGKKTMVVYGDSHASMWMSALDQIGKESGYKVYLYAKLACPLIEYPIWSYQLNRPFKECTEWQRAVLPKIEALKPDLLVVTDQWKPVVIDGSKSDFDTPLVWEREFKPALEKLKGFAGRLVVLGNNPSMLEDSVNCASKPGANIALCGAGRAQAGNVKINAIEKSAAEAIGVAYINTVDLACTQYLCPIVINDIFVYFDQWHFTTTYVKWLVPVLKRSLLTT
jgi:hypothetical protein